MNERTYKERCPICKGKIKITVYDEPLYLFDECDRRVPCGCYARCNCIESITGVHPGFDEDADPDEVIEVMLQDLDVKLEKWLNKFPAFMRVHVGDIIEYLPWMDDDSALARVVSRKIDDDGRIELQVVAVEPELDDSGMETGVYASNPDERGTIHEFDTVHEFSFRAIHDKKSLYDTE